MLAIVPTAPRPATVPASRCADTPTPMPPWTIGSALFPRITSGGNTAFRTVTVPFGSTNRAVMSMRPGSFRGFDRATVPARGGGHLDPCQSAAGCVLVFLFLLIPPRIAATAADAPRRPQALPSVQRLFARRVRPPVRPHALDQGAVQALR